MCKWTNSPKARSRYLTWELFILHIIKAPDLPGVAEAEKFFMPNMGDRAHDIFLCHSVSVFLIYILIFYSKVIRLFLFHIQFFCSTFLVHQIWGESRIWMPLASQKRLAMCKWTIPGKALLRALRGICSFAHSIFLNHHGILFCKKIILFISKFDRYCVSLTFYKLWKKVQQKRPCIFVQNTEKR